MSLKNKWLLLLLTAFIYSCNNSSDSKNSNIIAGATSGNFSVDNSGQANYSIPIAVPPGTNNMQPSMSLSYNSRGGNGNLGVGWTIAGLSSITRGGSTKAVDGKNTSVSYGSTDRFFLDGSELILDNTSTPSTEYGDAGSKYVTAIKDHNTIVANGNQGTNLGPSSFTVYTSDGKIMEYGGAPDSQIPGLNNGIRVWAISKVTDLNGNSMTYSYEIIKGSYRISNISYTANTAAGLKAGRQVSFAYKKTRPDSINKWDGGVNIVTNFLLESITTQIIASPAKTIKQYNLKYGQNTQTNLSQLTSVQECDGSGNCFNPTIFQWGSATSPTDPYPPTHIQGPVAMTKFYHWENQSDNPRMPADINGDGRTDMIGFANTNTTAYLSNGNSIGGSPIVFGGFGQNSFPDQYNTPRLMADINADGMSDILGFGHDMTFYALSNGNGFDNMALATFDFCQKAPFSFLNDSQFPRMTGDINGDGYPDIIGFKPNNVWYALNLREYPQTGPLAFSISQPGPPAFVPPAYPNQDSTPRVIADINADGMDDIIGFGQDKTYYSLSNGKGFDPLQVLTYDFNVNIGFFKNSVMPRLLGDINGDGLLDIVGFKYDRFFYAFNTGNFSGNPQPLTGTVDGYQNFCFAQFYVNQDLTPRMLQDINGDGMADIIAFAKDSVSYALSNGFGFEKPRLATDYYSMIHGEFFNQSEYPRFLLDINGDGSPDILGCSDTAMEMTINQTEMPHQIRSIHNGNSNVITINYKSLTDTSVYSPGPRPSAPLKLLQPPVQVVSSYNFKPENPGSAPYDYEYSLKYGGATSDTIIGWLGFDWQRETDVIVSKTSYFNKTYPLIGSVDSTITIQGTTHEHQSTIRTATAGALLGKFPYTVQQNSKTSLQYHIPSGQAPICINYSFNKNWYDSNNNVVKSATVIARNKSAPETKDSLFNFYSYKNVLANSGNTNMYLLEYQKSSTVGNSSITSFNKGDKSWLRQHFYDASGNYGLSSKGVYDNINNEWLSDSFTYDPYGNVVASIGPRSGKTQYIYDKTYCTFIDSVISPKNQNGDSLITSFTYEPGFGNLYIQVTPNGVKSKTLYDGFGREVSHYGPDPTNKNQLTKLDTTIYTVSTDPQTAYTVEMKGRSDWSDGNIANWYWNVDYIDPLGRMVKSEAKGPIGQIVATEKVYSQNIFDQVSKETMPYYPDSTGTTTDELWLRFYYYPDGRLMAQTISGDSISSKYDPVNGKVFETTNSGAQDSATTINFIDARGILYQRQDPNGGLTKYYYGLSGLLDSIIDPNGVVNATLYNSLDKPIQISNPDNGVTHFAYDKGLLTNKSVEDVNGKMKKVFDYEYDLLDRLITQTHYVDSSVVGATDQLFYDGAYTKGMLDSVARNSSYVTNSQKIGTVSMPFGPKLAYAYKYGYDGYGQINMKKSHLPAPSDYWSNVNCQVAVSSKLSATNVYTALYCYNPGGNVTQQTYPDGSVQNYFYYADGSLRDITLKDPNIAKGATQNIVHYGGINAFSQPDTVIYNNGVSSNYVYQAGNSLLKQHLLQNSKDTLISNNFYWDNRMLLDSIIDMRKVASSEKESQSFTYNNMGWLEGANSVNKYGSISYNYNAGGDLIQKNQSIYHIGKGHQLKEIVKYDSVKKDSVTAYSANYNPNGGISSSQSLDSTTGPAGNYNYSFVPGDLANEIHLNAPNGAVKDEYLTLYYDFSGSKIAQTDALINSSQLQTGSKVKLFVSDNSAITGEINNVSKGVSDSYTFNKYINSAEGKVAMTKTPWSTVSLMAYENSYYDGFDESISTFIGNTTSSSSLMSLTLSRNLLFETIPQGIGQLILILATLLLMAWMFKNIRNHIRHGKKKLQIKSVWIYHSKPFVTASLVTFFILGVNPVLLSQPDQNASGPSGSASILYFHSDHINSLQLVTDQSGNVLNRINYDPYGEETSSSKTAATSAAFTGQKYNSGLGLYFFNARFYNPFTARFISADSELGRMDPNSPVAFNRYAYGANNPVEYIDPSGHFAFLVGLLVAGVISAVVSAGVDVAVQAVQTKGFTTGSYDPIQTLGSAAIGFAAGFIGAGIGAAASQGAMVAIRGAVVAGKIGARAAGAIVEGTGAMIGSVAGQATANTLEIARGNTMSAGDWGKSLALAGVSGLFFGGISGALRGERALNSFTLTSKGASFRQGKSVNIFRQRALLNRNPVIRRGAIADSGNQRQIANQAVISLTKLNRLDFIANNVALNLGELSAAFSTNGILGNFQHKPKQ